MRRCRVRCTRAARALHTRGIFPPPTPSSFRRLPPAGRSPFATPVRNTRAPTRCTWRGTYWSRRCRRHQVARAALDGGPARSARRWRRSPRRPSIRRGCTRSRGRAAAHWAKGHAQQRSPHNHLHVCPAILETFYKARHKNFAQTQLTQGSVRCVSGTPAVEARQGGGRVRGANGDHAVSRLLKNDDGTDGICSARGVSGGRSQAHLSDRLISRS